MSKRIISMMLVVLLVVMSMGLPVGAEEPEYGGGLPPPPPSPIRFTVTVTSTGEGTGSVSGGGLYMIDTRATLTATPDPDSLFDKWQVQIGSHWFDCGTQTTLETLPLFSNISFRAWFTRKPIEPLTVSFDQAHSVPGGTFTWIVHNTNSFQVLYQYSLSTSEGPEGPMSAMQTALPGDNTVTHACVDQTVARIDTMRIIWGFGPAYGDLAAPEDAAALCPPKPTPPPSATAQSTPWFVLKASAKHGDIQDSGMSSIIPVTRHWTGSVLTLTAVPIGKSLFDGWSGDLGGMANPATLTMNADKTIEALFDTGIGFQKMIRLPMSDETVIPEDGQFTFRLQALEPVVRAPSLDDFELPPVPYDQTVSNDEDGWVQFWSNPELRMFLEPGYYLLTEEVEAGYSPCTIPDGGLVLKLKGNGRFHVVGPYIQAAVSGMLAAASDEGPDYCGPQEPFVVYNCEIPVPGLAIDKKANGSDGPVTVSTGSTVSYTIRVTNTGNVTVSAIELEDNLSPDMPYDPFLLGPGAYKDFDYQKTYPAAGTYVNTATAAGFWMDLSIEVSGSDAMTADHVRGLPDMPNPFVGPVTDTVTVYVTAPPAPSPSPSPSPSPVPNVVLTVTVEGPGTALPGSGAYGLNSIVQMTVTPGDGAAFVGWFGPNGAEVADNRITMNTDKSIIARFEVPAPPQESPVPQAAPVVEASPAIATEPVPEAAPIVMPLEEVVPQAAPALPKTGGVAGMLYLLLGSGLLVGGAVLPRKRR